MILTDTDINSLLIRLAKMNNLMESDHVKIQENGWSLTVEYGGIITADLRDSFGQPKAIPVDMMRMIEDGMIKKLGL